MRVHRRLLTAVAACAAAVLTTHTLLPAQSRPDADLAREIFETMSKLPGADPARRPVHAKGVVCTGVFVPSKDAAGLSRAAHFAPDAIVSVTARLSDGAPSHGVADGSPDAGPRGLAVRFATKDGQETDVVAMSHNGFVVGTGEEFLALQKAVVATDPSGPHPWPIERFLAGHPRAMKFVRDNRTVPASFATESFFGNNAFVFVDRAGARRAGRYQFLPVAGSRHLTEAAAKAQAPNYLFDDLKSRLAAGPVQYRLVAQLADPGDATNDSSLVWPADRKTVELGVISLTAIVPDAAAAERRLAFDPANLTDGIELSDDPLPALRSLVYALSAKHRRAE
ncbi:MAG TPA: catalase family peroxidase [Humisphaera sp.]